MLTKKSKIIQMLTEFPNARNVDIAKEIGVLPAYVSVVRQRNGFPTTSRATGSAITVSPANSQWVTKQALANGVTINQMVNAIITDARLENDND